MIRVYSDAFLYCNDTAGKYSKDSVPKGPRGGLFKDILPQAEPLLNLMSIIADERNKTMSQVSRVENFDQMDLQANNPTCKDADFLSYDMQSWKQPCTCHPGACSHQVTKSWMNYGMQHHAGGDQLVHMSRHHPYPWCQEHVSSTGGLRQSWMEAQCRWSTGAECTSRKGEEDNGAEHLPD